MNEAANMCPYPCPNPEQYSKENDLPPKPPSVRASNPRPLPGFPSDFQPSSSKRGLGKREQGQKIGLPDRNLISPPYKIRNAAGGLSQKTIDTDLVHSGGYVEYDTHNMYGTSKYPHTLARDLASNQNSDGRCLTQIHAAAPRRCETIGHYSQHLCRSWDASWTLVSLQIPLNLLSILTNQAGRQPEPMEPI